MEIILNMSSWNRALLTAQMLFLATAASANSPNVEVQCVLVERAQIAQKPLAGEGEFGRANHGHQIVDGTRNVLAIRIFDDPDRGPDSETFKKATLEFVLPPTIVDGAEIPVNVLRSYYTDGSSGWVHKGNYWWARDPFPTIQFTRDKSGLIATLKQNIQATHAAKVFHRPPQLIPVDITCLVRKLAVLRLTPWTGRVGTNWLSFYSQGVAE